MVRLEHRLPREIRVEEFVALWQKELEDQGESERAKAFKSSGIFVWELSVGCQIGKSLLIPMAVEMLGVCLKTLPEKYENTEGLQR